MLLESVSWDSLHSSWRSSRPISPDEVLLEVHGCYVVQLQWGHVDWGESRGGSAERHFFRTHVEAQRAAESHRSQGRYFSTTSIPSLCLRGVTSSYLVIDEPSDEPFADLVGCRPAQEGGTVFPGAKLAEVLEVLVTDSSMLGRFQRSGVFAARALDDRWYPRLNGSNGDGYGSHSLGAGRWLGWNRGPSGYFEDGVEALVRSFREMAARNGPFAEAMAVAVRFEERQAKARSQEESDDIWLARRPYRERAAGLLTAR